VTRRSWFAPAAVALIALAACVTSIGHDFTFDDRYVILENANVHLLKNIWRLWGQTYWPVDLGGDGYRPLVMSLFTIQWAAGGGAPWLFHLVNIGLAVAAALAVYWCAAAILPRAASGAAAALFAVHPVHVEVTGNVVGQSELLVAIFLCLAIGLYLRARREGPLRPRTAAAIIGLYIAGLGSKEHAIVLPMLLVAAEFTVLAQPGWKARAKELRTFGLLLALVSVAFIFVLEQIHGGVTGFVSYPAFQYLNMSALDRAATMAMLLPRIARLFVFPTQLRGDYSPTDVAISQGFDVQQLPGIFICVSVLLLIAVLRRRDPVVSFGLLWLVIAFLPVSNLLVPTGFMIAERTFFFPSVGVVLVAGAIVARVDATAATRPLMFMRGAVGLLLALGLIRSVDRQRVWKNNSVFFDALVKDAPDSYRGHFLRGRVMRLEGRLPEMEAEYRRAIALFPYDPRMMLAIAADYHNVGACTVANAYLRWTFALEPKSSEGRVAYVQCLAHEKEWQEARTQALAGMSIVQPYDVRRLRVLLAQADSALGRPRHLRQSAHAGVVAIR
jgi:protein O-mannosyl-transferase